MPRSKTTSHRGDSVPAALGFRAHSGWAVLLAVAGSPREPVVVERRRIKTCDPGIPGSKQPYHTAESWPLPKAEEFLDRCARRTNELSRQAVAEVVAELKQKGHQVIGCGILGASGRPVVSVEAALASHTMLHTAEGELYRNALIAASEHFGIAVTKVSERELLARASAALRVPAERLRHRTTEMGQPLGAPWTQDEKHATLIAWMVLAVEAHQSRAPKRSLTRGRQTPPAGT